MRIKSTLFERQRSSEPRAARHRAIDDARTLTRHGSLNPLELTTLVLLGTALLAIFQPQVAVAADKPNVVIIYGDDVGFGDVGVNDCKLIPTPNTDRLASEGLNFRDAHSSASTCTPSRFSLLTGIHAFRHKLRILPPNAPLIIPTDQPTLATVFKEAGYGPARLGSWSDHKGVGEARPNRQHNGDLHQR